MLHEVQNILTMFSLILSAIIMGYCAAKQLLIVCGECSKGGESETGFIGHCVDSFLNSQSSGKGAGRSTPRSLGLDILSWRCLLSNQKSS